MHALVRVLIWLNIHLLTFTTNNNGISALNYFFIASNGEIIILLVNLLFSSVL